MVETDKIFEEFLEIIKKDTTEVSFNTWFKPLAINKIDEALNIIYLNFDTDNDFIIKIVKDRYIQLIEKSFKQVLGESYRVIVKSSEEYKEEVKEKNVPVIDDEEEKIFNPKYNFDNFVVGDCNKFAHAAALAVAESPSEAYNPLFLYGDSGLGKTHLMHAIGIHLLKNNPSLNVLYVSSEMFTNDFIKAIKDKQTLLFKKKYRELDVLLIDDIQFLEGKDKIQEEFFYTFNALYDLNKQIIISSDRAPGKLVDLAERLKNRFSWNLIADIQPADYETRVAILIKKAEIEGIEVTDTIYEVICLIAEKVENNIRELEGAFQRVISFANIMEEEITLQFAKNTLKEIIFTGEGNITPEKIKKVVCKYYNIKVTEMDSQKKTNNIALPRQIAMYICREMTDYSLPKIGKIFGGRHYTTVMHACDKIQKEINSNANTKEIIHNLETQIKEE